PLSAPAATLLREPLGYDLLIFSQDDYDGLDGGIAGYHDTTLAFRTALDDGSTLPGMIVHPASRWLDPDETAAHGMTATDGAIAIMAELRVTRSELGAGLHRSAVLAAPVGVVPDPDLLAALGTYATDTPDTRLATLTELPAATDVQVVPGTGPEVVQLPESAGTDLNDRVARIDVVRVDATAAGSMPLDPAQAEEWDAELDQLVSTNLDEAEVDATLARIAAETQAVYDCVATPNPFTFTLTGRSSTLRLNLTNECDEDLGVVVHPTSAKLTFPNGDVARTLAANSVTEVEIEVESRSNGTSGITIDVLTPVGSLPVQEPLVLTARVNALSGLGQLVTGGALLVLISWWYGHFRRRRRIRRALIGEVDNPVNVGAAVSPDAAEAVPDPPRDEPVPTPSRTDSVSEP
ncbi:MAG TPA: hypothetical protein VFT09_09260, partial [Ilumatobacteraceae bacterium]|nr:hypothetical protein [Ilumatobacteraceae bacterium]